MTINSPKLINKTPLMYPKKIQKKFLPANSYNKPKINIKKGPLLYVGLAVFFMIAGAVIEKATQTGRTIHQLKFFIEHPKLVERMFKTSQNQAEQELPADTISFNKVK